jgi:hypothetical protein
LAQCFRWPLNWSNTKSLFPPNALTPRQHLISASLYPIDNLVPLDLLTSTHFYFQHHLLLTHRVQDIMLDGGACTGK